MRITIAQLNYKIGNFKYNLDKIKNAINKAKEEKSDLIIFSELAICGYPPLDLIGNKKFISKSLETIKSIVCESHDIAIIIGSPWICSNELLFNSALFIYQGEIKEIINKTNLPSYGMFNESYYFKMNKEYKVIEFKGKKIGITIGEDLWFQQPLIAKKLNNKFNECESPLDKIFKFNPDFIINISALPFSYLYLDKVNILVNNARIYRKPIIYVNQVGGYTDLIFEGGSCMVSEKAKVKLLLPYFKESVFTFNYEELYDDASSDYYDLSLNEEKKIELLHDALVSGIKDFFSKNGFDKAILGLSGGIDSAVVTILAVEALGSNNVHVLLMPSKFSSSHSITDAKKLAENLKIKYDIISIQDIFECYNENLSKFFNNLPFNVAEENLQARIRANLLMAFSNKFGYILLNTSNKSELLVGYGTLYGDLCGSLSVIGDIYKTDVYNIANYINKEKEIIPLNIITKIPSAELRENQKDIDALPPYDILDKILFNYIELDKSFEDLINNGFDKDTVKYVIELINKNRFKKLQIPPVLNVSKKAVGLETFITLDTDLNFIIN